MPNDKVFEELKEYGEKFGRVVQGLSEYNSLHNTQENTKSDKENTPREVVFQDNKLSLYHYLPSSHQSKNTQKNQTQIKTPVLIVYALVNRPTILDLEEEHSAIAKMLQSGLDVYLIDWGYPERLDKDIDLNNYVNGQLDACVELICQSHSVNAINLLGVCQGGVLSLCYSCLHQDRIKNLVTMVTPVDFHTEDDMLSHWVKHVDIDLMVDTFGNIPGSMLSNTFLSLKPYQLQLKKYLDLINTIDKFENSEERISNFISMEQWIFDSPDQTGETFRHFIKSCYQQNQLIKGELEIGDKRIDLAELKISVLNVYAEQDHLVPPAASKALKKVIGSDDYQEMPVSGGHIGIFVSKKAVDTIFPAIAAWFGERD